MIAPVRRLAALVLAFGLGAAALAAAQDSLANARALYTSAEYEQALTTLNRMRSTGMAATDVPAVEQYRALCLLALGRGNEAEDAIAAVVAAAPSYSPADTDVSPRVRLAFSEVRRRVLPGIIQQRYEESKGAFDRKDYTAASEGFNQVLKTLNDPELAAVAGQPPLADLRTLAKGFQDLSINAIAATTPPAPPARSEPVAPPAPAVPAAKRIYSVTDTNVVQPVIIRQTLPAFPRKPIIPARGVVEVVIDESGRVETTAIRVPIDQMYDSIALAASRNWHYKPATREGVPVKFRKLVEIRIQP